MKNTYWIASMIAVWAPLASFADGIVPIEADSEGLSQFENNVAKGAVIPAASNQSTQRVRAAVSAEAIRLKAEGSSQKSGFAQWTGTQKSKGTDPSNPSVSEMGGGVQQGSSGTSPFAVPAGNWGNSNGGSGNGHGGHGTGH